jgi:phage terminase large subunit-like protein
VSCGPIVGRRRGKSRIAAAIAVYLACFIRHKLAAGERGMVLTLAPFVEQSRVVFGCALSFLRKTPVLRQEIARRRAMRSDFTMASSSRFMPTASGRCEAKRCSCIFDKEVYWRNDSTARRRRMSRLIPPSCRQP